jgi:hypothetical protein
MVFGSGFYPNSVMLERVVGLLNVMVPLRMVSLLQSWMRPALCVALIAVHLFCAECSASVTCVYTQLFGFLEAAASAAAAQMLPDNPQLIITSFADVDLLYVQSSLRYLNEIQLSSFFRCAVHGVWRHSSI